MIIYPAELEDNLQEVIKSQSSVSYASLALSADDHAKQKSKSLKSIASFDDDDLYYVQSILVTSSWNKNDDIFDKVDMWNARHTPEDKPTNLEHDENLIIGHITSNWAVTDDGVLIDEQTPVENLPNKFHILTGSVVYRAFTSEELKSRAETLIQQIESGNKYVSMECYFKNFDYGLIDKTSGEFKIIKRDESTAHLTKHLRAYGGLGEHDGYKIGRILRDITFSGKGFVDRPANEESIIFSKNDIDQNFGIKKNINLEKEGVISNKSISHAENIEMNLEKEVNELKERVSALSNTDCSDTVKEAYSLASDLKTQNHELNDSVKSAEAKIEELSKALSDAQAQIEVISEEKLQLTTSLEELNTTHSSAVEAAEASQKAALEAAQEAHAEEITKLKQELDSALEVVAGYKEKEEELKKKEKMMKRVGALMDAGLSNDQATEAATKFENLEDELFAEMTTLLASTKPVEVEVQAEEVETTESTEVEAEEDDSSEAAEVADLEEAEIEPSVNLSVGGEDNSAVDTRAELIEFVCARLGKSTNKGE